MIIYLLPLRVQLAFYAFALAMPTAAIKTFSFLSDMPVAAGFYVLGALASVLVFWIFFMLMWSVMSWAGERA